MRLASVDSITIYASRAPQSAFDFAGEVSVIDRAEIDDFVPSTVSDLFQAVPGARFQGGPRRTGEAPAIRGLGGAGVLVLFDGARQSFLSGHDGRFFIDPDLLKSVEVVKGPASALYGSGALGGVIALRTVEAGDLLEAGETAGLKLSGSFASVDEEWRSSATGFWRSDDGGLDALASLTYRRSGDIALGSGLDLPADDEILSALVKGTARLGDGVSVSASWQRYADDSVDPNNPQGAGVVEPGNAEVARAIRGDTVQGRLAFAPEGSAFFDLDLTAYYTRNKVEEDETQSPREVSREVETIGVALVNRSHVDLADGARVTFTYGGEAYRDEQTGRDNMSADGSRGGVPDSQGTFLGLFAQGELALSGALGTVTLTPGVRWDRFETKAEGEEDVRHEKLSPKLGLAYRPLDWLLLFGNWAKAFRAPSFDELYADGQHFQIPNLSMSMVPPIVTNSFVANPDLRPESSESWEIGAGFDFGSLLAEGDRLVAKGSYWNANVEDLVDLEVNIPAGCFGAPFPACGSGPAFGNFSRYVNVHNAELDGIEIEADYESDLVYARANFSSIDGEDVDTGLPVGVLSPDRFFVDTGVRIAALDLRIGTRVTLAGDFDEVDDPAEARGGYATGDLYAVWTPRFAEGMRIDVGVDNVTDEDYEVVNAGVSEPGRSFKLAVSWRTAW
ncbi:MAG: TonB-dependent receptor [Alphaproteobacteria bacterium]|nr:TonB-dependent receptor [Alphaproteobacteria bacterium]